MFCIVVYTLFTVQCLILVRFLPGCSCYLCYICTNIFVLLHELNDNDDSSNNCVCFSDGNEDDVFSIDPQNGNVIIARQLDWESRSWYNLSIMATDGLHRIYTQVCESLHQSLSHCWVMCWECDVTDNSKLKLKLKPGLRNSIRSCRFLSKPESFMRW